MILTRDQRLIYAGSTIDFWANDFYEYTKLGTDIAEVLEKFVTAEEETKLSKAGGKYANRIK